MSQVMRNIAQLQNSLDRYATYITDKIADKIKITIEEFIKYYYKEYTPEFYSRVWNFLNSVVRTDVKRIGNSCCAEIYIDTSITYYNGWTMEGTAKQANQGFHGYYHPVKVGDMRFWCDALKEIHSKQFLDQFTYFFKTKGLTVTVK